MLNNSTKIAFTKKPKFGHNPPKTCIKFKKDGYLVLLVQALIGKVEIKL